MKYRLFISIAAASVLGNTAFAGTMGSVTPSKNWNWVGSIAGGPVWARGGETQTFYLAPEIEKTYVADKSTKVLASGELFAAIQKTFSSQWQLQLGVAAAAASRVKLQGLIWDDADPRFENYSYQYKIQHSHVAAKGKLLKVFSHGIIPWVGGSIGVGFNRAYGFSNTPLIFQAVENSNFTNHTKTTFTYTASAGVQKVLSKHWQVGAGYQFADWGKSELGRAEEQTLNTGLTLNHLYTNGVLFNLTYTS